MKSKGNMLIVYIMLIGLAFIVLTIVNVVIPNLKEVGHKTSGSQAFYIAEAGLSKAIWYLATDPGDGGKGEDWRGSTTEAFGRGSYNITVQDTAVSCEVLIISTGEVYEETSTILQRATTLPLPAAFNYAIFSGSGDLNATGDPVISGDLFISANTTFTGNPQFTDGAVYHPEGYSVSGVPDGGTPDSEPSMPDFDTSYYDGQIAVAEAVAPGDQIYQDLDLGGGTIYVNGNINFIGAGNINGPGTIVATGNILITGNPQSDGSNITFISKRGTEVRGNSELPHSHFYARGNFEVTAPVVITVGSLLTSANFLSTDDMDFSGIIYCDGEANITSTNPIITGSLVANSIPNIPGNLKITYNPGVFPSPPPPGISGSSVLLIKGTWQEL